MKGWISADLSGPVYVPLWSERLVIESIRNKKINIMSVIIRQNSAKR